VDCSVNKYVVILSRALARLRLLVTSYLPWQEETPTLSLDCVQKITSSVCVATLATTHVKTHASANPCFVAASHVTSIFS
jgi:hypothetical protein